MFARAPRTAPWNRQWCSLKPTGMVIRSILWETVGMAKKKRRIPKKGDRVAVDGRKGAYVVYLVDGSLEVADLKQIGGDSRLATIPWKTLTFLDDENASQAAARMVREATEEN
jgi:hypothetical protein